MASYERNTAASMRDALRLAEEILTERLPIKKTGTDGHALTLEGGDGKVRIEAHKHGLATTVQATTDQLRTSRLDTEVQFYMSRLPYEPGDDTSRGD